jgi:hypothetical protein
MDGVRFIDKPVTPEVTALRTALLEKLQRVNLTKLVANRVVQNGPNKGVRIRLRGDLIGDVGRTDTFGFGRTRTKGWVDFRSNTKHPEIYKLLCEYGQHVVPSGVFFNCITLNQNVQAKKHIDSQNVGDSVIVGIGDYEGGKLRVYDASDVFTAYDIKDHPLQFNGNTFAHETEPFTGTRWTIIYYSQGRKESLVHPSIGL